MQEKPRRNLSMDPWMRPSQAGKTCSHNNRMIWFVK